MIVSGGNHSTLSLAAGEILTVIASAVGSGTVYRLADSVGGQAQGVTAIAAGETQTFGPFNQTTRFDVVCTTGYLTYSSAVADLTDLNLDNGSVVLSKDYADSSSYQPIAADLNLAAGAGTSDAGDTSFLAPIMGNVTGADLTKTHNYIGGVIGANSVTGTKATELPVAGVLGVLMDGAVNADGIVVAHIDGGDPSTETTALAAFGVTQANNHANSGVQYGLNLFYEPTTEVDALLSGTAEPFKVTKAILRSPSQVCWLEGAGVPVDGTTGDNFAGKGSLYTDTTNGDLYIQTSAITTPVWKLVTRAS